MHSLLQKLHIWHLIYQNLHFFIYCFSNKAVPSGFFFLQNDFMMQKCDTVPGSVYPKHVFPVKKKKHFTVRK